MDFQVVLGQLINRFSCHALDSSRTPSEESICANLLDVRKIGEELGWLSFLFHFTSVESNTFFNLQFKMAWVLSEMAGMSISSKQFYLQV